jgi:hypothetical protein
VVRPCPAQGFTGVFPFPQWLEESKGYCVAPKSASSPPQVSSLCVHWFMLDMFSECVSTGEQARSSMEKSQGMNTDQESIATMTKSTQLNKC